MFHPGQYYTVRMAPQTLLADNGDFFQLVGVAAVRAEILAVNVWQRGTATLGMDAITLRRGTGGTGGVSITTERKWAKRNVTNGLQPLSLPTTDVTLDWEWGIGWNLVSGVQWLSTPDMRIPLQPNDDFAIGREGAVQHTLVGCSVAWVEWDC